MRIGQNATARRMTTLTLAALTTTALLGGTASQAAPATASDSSCPFTRALCLWDGTDYTGARFTVQALNPATGTCVDLAAHGWGNGRARSGKNTATQTARLYPTTDCTGTVYQIVAGGSYGTISFASNSVYVY